MPGQFGTWAEAPEPRAFFYYDDDEESAANVLFRYTYRPGADLFVVHNEERDIGTVPSAIKLRELIVKFALYFVLF